MDAEPTRKQRSHDRIVEAAARAIRRDGYGGVGVADVMREAGLTHGGFYAHFASRDALLVEALERAGRRQRVAVSVSAVEACASARRQPLPGARRGLPRGPPAEDARGRLSGRRAVFGDAAPVARRPQGVERSGCRRWCAMSRTRLPPSVPAERLRSSPRRWSGSLQLARAIGRTEQGKALLAASRRSADRAVRHRLSRPFFLENEYDVHHILDHRRRAARLAHVPPLPFESTGISREARRTRSSSSPAPTAASGSRSRAWHSRAARRKVYAGARDPSTRDARRRRADPSRRDRRGAGRRRRREPCPRRDAPRQQRRHRALRRLPRRRRGRTDAGDSSRPTSSARC